MRRPFLGLNESTALTAGALFLVAFTRANAQTPAPSRQTPPPGIAINESDHRSLAQGVDALRKEIDALRTQPFATPFLPDVAIFHKAADWALRYNEFFDPKQIDVAKTLLEEGRTRAAALRDRKAPWSETPGHIVRGYRSRIDDSIQPYGLVVPPTWKAGDKRPRPLWCWFHGRSEKLTELAFVDERMKKKGEFAPDDTFVLHLYGRFCNANKFAGETDLFEALEDVRRRYPIDPNRIAVVGFSMGGAAGWHVAAHHAGLWAAASPGAGFAETAQYAKVFAAGKEPPPWFEQKLWRLYDATEYAANLANCPLIAYSGEIDPQKQSADIMEAAMSREGLKLERLIGPKTAHKYEPETKKELERRLSDYVKKGREEMPAKVRFTTYTLRYHKMEWIEIDALEKHWERAHIDAELVDEGGFRVATKNVAAFTIALPVAPAPLDKTRPPRLLIDDQEIVGPAVTDRWTAHFRKTNGRWANVASRETPGLSKTHGLTGPIDDAFMDSFIFVKPTGKPLNEKIGAWSTSECNRAIDQWRTVFRGEPRVKNDTAITPGDVQSANLILWGDPSSNVIIGKLAGKLPVQWSREKLMLGKHSLDAGYHAPVLIYPNPLNPRRYVVINSGFTFREGSAQTNSQQTPKLPDWALIDLRTPPDKRAPGAIVDAGFFGEQWELIESAR
jgi:hypothetical protein